MSFSLSGKKQPMDEKELDALIDNAPEQKVRECLKEIVSIWFVEDGESRIVNFDKDLGSDHIEAVTIALHSRGFCPPENQTATEE